MKDDVKFGKRFWKGFVIAVILGLLLWGGLLGFISLLIGMLSNS